ncbi:MAG: GspE/PulE family protein [Armatimonadota bacterium]
MQQFYKKAIGDLLVSMGVITQSQLEEALAEQKRSLKKLGEVLVSLGMVEEEQITEARALQLDVPYINLQDYQFDPEVLLLIGESVARANKCIPAKREGNKLVVATTDPLDIEAIDLIQFGTKLRVEAALGTEWRIMDAINRHYGNDACDDLHECVELAASNVDLPTCTVEDPCEDIDEVKRQSHRAPIVRMVNLLLTQALRKRASDIHIEPRRANMDVRYRIDGELHLIRSIPKALQGAVISRIKIMSELDIAERRLPQDGRITVTIDGKTIDLRVSTSPSLHGERVVLRVLDRSAGLIPLDFLGFSERNQQIFRNLIARPYGIILVTGPTGSGKTTTLYAALNSMKSERTNIMTLEDPIEYELDGINQTSMHHKIGLTFPTQLRSILRQDPDIVLVGEIRDGETADVAFRAALTGHLVLSTLHANDAPSSATRLLDMGVEPFLVSSAINGVMAQRLVKLLCPECKEAYEADARERQLLGIPISAPGKLYRAKGCDACNQTGYKGRTTVCEILVMTDQIRQLILSSSSATDILRNAERSGFHSMRDDAAEKVLAGITTMEEFTRKVFIESDVLDIGNSLQVA